MRISLKHRIALILALFLCVSAFSACGPEEPENASFSSPVSSTYLPAYIDPVKGQLSMAADSTYADLLDDLRNQGEIKESERVRLFFPDQVTEVIDELTPLENGMLLVKFDLDGNEIIHYIIHILEEDHIVSRYTDQSGNTVIVTPSDTYVYTSDSVNRIPTPEISSEPTVSSALSSSGAPSASGSSLSSLSSESTAASLPEPEEDRAITVAGDINNRSLQQAIFDYRKQNPQIKINLVSAFGDTGGTTYTSVDNLKLQLHSGKAPDVVFMDYLSLAQAGYDDLLFDIGQLGSKEVEEKYHPAFWAATCSSITGENKQFGLPFDANVLVQLGNQELLTNAGLSALPSNYDELLSACSALQTLPGVSAPYALYPSEWITWLWRSGGDLFTSALTEAAFDSDAGVRALEKYVDFHQRYEVSSDKMNDAFYQDGTVGLSMAPSYQFPLVSAGESGPSFRYGLLAQLEPNVPRHSMLGLYALGLPNKVDQKMDEISRDEALSQTRAAYDFMEFYSAGFQYQNEYCSKNFLLPSLMEAKGQGIYQGEYWDTVYAQLALAKNIPGVDSWGQIQSYLNEAVRQAVSGTRSPQEALKAAAVQTNRLLAQ